MVSGTSPKGVEKDHNNYVKAAESMGYHITADEIVEAMKDKDREQRSRTAMAENAVQKEALSEEMLGVVSGGGNHDECNDTFIDGENCWFTDQCDIIFSHYGLPQDNKEDFQYDYMCASNYNETYEDLFDISTW